MIFRRRNCLSTAGCPMLKALLYCAALLAAILGLLFVAEAFLSGSAQGAPHTYELHCFRDGKQQYKSGAYSTIFQGSRADDWVMTGDGLTDYRYVYRQVPGEVCVRVEAAPTGTGSQ